VQARQAAVQFAATQIEAAQAAATVQQDCGIEVEGGVHIRTEVVQEVSQSTGGGLGGGGGRGTT
jgi:hypothetical protein